VQQQSSSSSLQATAGSGVCHSQLLVCMQLLLLLIAAPQCCAASSHPPMLPAIQLAGTPYAIKKQLITSTFSNSSRLNSSHSRLRAVGQLAQRALAAAVWLWVC
jgi:hypothetical protein